MQSYPTFKGEERHLLKCQIVRISHNCQIVPNGLYAPVEDEAVDDVEFAEDFKLP